MNTRKVAEEYRLSKWAGIIQERKSSGKSVKDFCFDSDISMSAYFYWQRKLRETACEKIENTNEYTEMVPAGWMQLSTEQQNKTATIEIEIGDCRINVNKETDPALLKQVCLMLRSL